MTTRCYEMKKGQKLVCTDCGFTMLVDEECDQHCKKEGCCDTEDIFCCGEPMVIR